MIACPKCQTDNDLGRIFCVKCGEKLDISKVTAPGGGKGFRKKKKGKPLDKVIASVTGKAVKLAFLALACALFTLVWLPPRMTIREFSGANFSAYAEKRTKLQEAIESQELATLTFEQGDLNAAMAQIVQKTVEAAGEVKGFNLESIYIEPQQGEVLTTVQSKWKSFRLVVQVYAKPDNKTGKWDFNITRILVGRMPIPQQLHAKLSEVFIRKLWMGFTQEAEWIGQMDEVAMKPGQVVLKTRKEG